MGRGRAKAKQTKVARDLKYHTQDTDFSALQRELGTPAGSVYRSPDSDSAGKDPYVDDEYDEDGWARRSG
jgi:hypothetical protein